MENAKMNIIFSCPIAALSTGFVNARSFIVFSRSKIFKEENQFFQKHENEMTCDSHGP